MCFAYIKTFVADVGNYFYIPVQQINFDFARRFVLQFRDRFLIDSFGIE